MSRYLRYCQCPLSFFFCYDFFPFSFFSVIIFFRYHFYVFIFFLLSFLCYMLWYMLYFMLWRACGWYAISGSWWRGDRSHCTQTTVPWSSPCPRRRRRGRPSRADTSATSQNSPVTSGHNVLLPWDVPNVTGELCDVAEVSAMPGCPRLRHLGQGKVQGVVVCI